jgi:hypothetical protein
VRDAHCVLLKKIVSIPEIASIPPLRRRLDSFPGLCPFGKGMATPPASAFMSVTAGRGETARKMIKAPATVNLMSRRLQAITSRLFAFRLEPLREPGR